jgi:transposase
MLRSQQITADSAAIGPVRPALLHPSGVLGLEATESMGLISAPRAHGVNANQVFNWRRLYQRGMLGGNAGTAGLVPVTVVDSQPGVQLAPEPAAPGPVASSVPPGTIQLQLPKDRLRIEGAADPASLRVVLERLLG